MRTKNHTVDHNFVRKIRFDGFYVLCRIKNFPADLRLHKSAGTHHIVLKPNTLKFGVLNYPNVMV